MSEILRHALTIYPSENQLNAQLKMNEERYKASEKRLALIEIGFKDARQMTLKDPNAGGFGCGMLADLTKYRGEP